ncbi:MAG: PQQ-dependent dehydrogenase, methanol/ethanol family [Gammaproteobacteria bacterium]|nr:PQQ-dependent dehydrogenase, methanol/ethanol family [Gammaproteobacteria bacterium]MBQ0840900.1 PQQ-dependent dehydrogenase, methanol/ethanol family [Gammaproteobacteria bacterium]
MEKITNKSCIISVALVCSLAITACSKPTSPPETTEDELPTTSVPASTLSHSGVDAKRIENADAEPGNWLAHGRTYSEQRFSPLDQINSKNVADLGLAWSYPLNLFRGIEATPLVIDGVMYTTGAWSVVFALNAATGELLWKYDPEVPKKKGVDACCDVVNRGVAAWGDKIYVGTLDGRLVALQAATGEVVWSTQTFDENKAYTITGAPRVVKGKVLIGSGGGEYDVRGYVSAYDADSGEMAWRFYTVPGNPENGQENEALKMAEKTWNGEWWRYGGGGTVWDSMVYDPELDLVYIGVGNGAPWNQRERSPGGGDNLFLSSIVALKADTGEYVWHYQTTPGETWDYTATQPIMLADLKIEGQMRKVLMQAPKNGFFYVLDRATGEFISAENYIPITWATYVDPETGRPVETPDARYLNKAVPTLPSSFGGHNWHPMSYSPNTGLVYLPAQEIPQIYADEPGGFEHKPGQFNTGVDFSTTHLPSDAKQLKGILNGIKGHLSAWDPVAQKEVWRVQYDRPWNGGTVATAGNLVFQGTADRRFAAYSADAGELLWEHQVNTGIVAGPVTYTVDGEQYIAVMSGWGSLMPIIGGVFITPEVAPIEGRVLVYKLGGKAELEINKPVRNLIKPPPSDATEEKITLGKKHYYQQCVICHGVSVISGGATPDLRYSPMLTNDAWFSVILDGVLEDNGMISFGERLNREEVDAIRAFVIDKANADWHARGEQE